MCEADNDENCMGLRAVDHVEERCLAGTVGVASKELYAKCRFEAYRWAARAMGDRWWQKGIRQPLPSCVEWAIKDRFPADSYTGFCLSDAHARKCTSRTPGTTSSHNACASVFMRRHLFHHARLC